MTLPTGPIRSRGRSSAGSNSRRSISLVALTFLVWFGLPLQAQVGQVEAGPALTGRVVDDATGRPIAGALVTVSERDAGAYSDDSGAFRLPVAADEAYRVEISQLGYTEEVLIVAAADLEEPLGVRLQPDPIELEGLAAFSDRYQSRRNAYAGPVQAYRQEHLQTSPAPSAFEIVMQRSAIRPCPADVRVRSASEEWCAWYRGGLWPVEVYLDGRPTFFDGLNLLREYSPHELYLVEVYDRGRTVRAFTRWGVENLREPLMALAVEPLQRPMARR